MEKVSNYKRYFNSNSVTKMHNNIRVEFGTKVNCLLEENIEFLFVGNFCN